MSRSSYVGLHGVIDASHRSRRYTMPWPEFHQKMPASMFPEVSVFCPNGGPRNRSVSEAAMNHVKHSAVSRPKYSRRRIWFLTASIVGFTVCVLFSPRAPGQTRPSALPDPTNPMMRTYNPQGAVLV